MHGNKASSASIKGYRKVTQHSAATVDMANRDASSRGPLLENAVFKKVFWQESAPLDTCSKELSRSVPVMRPPQSMV
jgi:hypothetical protein